MKVKIKKVIKLLQKNELGILPANIAYNFVLAIIPILTLTVLVASSFNISIDRVTTIIEEFLPYKVSNYIIEIISGRGFDKNIGIFNIIAFIVATNGTYAIIKCANNLYKIKDVDIIRDRIKSVILLINIILLLIFLVVVPIFGEKILLLCQNTNAFAGLTDGIILAINIIKWPITFITLLFNIKLIYTISPSKQILSKNTTIGAIFTTVFWMLFSLIFGYYIEYFANYDILYGNLSSIIILMIWLYALAYVFVLGMIINTVFYHENINEEN